MVERILGLRVSGIPAPKIFPHLMIGDVPETLQIVSDLDGPIVRAEQMEQDGNTAMCETRCLGPAKELLDRAARIGGRPVHKSSRTKRPLGIVIESGALVQLMNLKRSRRLCKNGNEVGIRLI